MNDLVWPNRLTAKPAKTLPTVLVRSLLVSVGKVFAG